MRYTYPGLIDFELDMLPRFTEWRVIFQIHSQDKSIMKTTPAEKPFYFETTVGLSITSDDFIDLTSSQIWLLGTKGYPDKQERQCTQAFSTIDDAEKYRERARLAFEELALSKGISLLNSQPELKQLFLWD